ncbi:MAG: ribulokinase [Deltaproteobacteria bacterium]|nr:MAG: ribulokinase [Deltaproteobacteria bacterium]
MTQTDGLYLGVDVGTGSARAGLFDTEGKMVGMGVREIRSWRPQADFVEQSSADIWDGCCAAVAAAVAAAGARPGQVRGVGFDATCSLVAVDDDHRPVSVSPDGRDDQNVIVWMDHRAIDQAERINATGHEVLKYVGGTISPEMEAPKLLWLRERLPESWIRARRFYDLPDFLTYRATCDETRSLCSTVCKWTYQGHEEPSAEGSLGRWDDSFWRQIGLGELVDEGYRRIGTRVRPMGEPLGQGLSELSARELGLRAGTAVGVSIIDAHAGGVGLLGAGLDADPGQAAEQLRHRLALIGGTSSCYMAASPGPTFVPGVWGPYFSAMIPGMWLSEGGQSATGSLIDHVVFGHQAAAELGQQAQRQAKTIYQLLNERLAVLAADEPFAAKLTEQLHVLPYFHGNRSPRADPTLRGMVSGLKLSGTVDDLAVLYLATIQAIAHGTRHIIAALNAQGFDIDTLYLCGGGTKNPVFLREHADATGCQLVLPQEPEAVLLGAAILGAAASGDFGSVTEAMGALSAAGQSIAPAGGDTARYHQAKHRVFQRMHADQLAYGELMTHPNR